MRMGPIGHKYLFIASDPDRVEMVPLNTAGDGFIVAADFRGRGI